MPAPAASSCSLVNAGSPAIVKGKERKGKHKYDTTCKTMAAIHIFSFQFNSTNQLLLLLLFWKRTLAHSLACLLRLLVCLSCLFVCLLHHVQAKEQGQGTTATTTTATTAAAAPCLPSKRSARANQPWGKRGIERERHEPSPACTHKLTLSCCTNRPAPSSLHHSLLQGQCHLKLKSTSSLRKSW